MNDTQELARIGATAPRRVIGVGAMALLGGLLLYLAVAEPPQAMFWQVFLIALGGFALWFAMRMWEATGHTLILTEDALTDSDGTLVARLDNIEKVDRSTFAMKPSNGFLILLGTPDGAAWRPGLWWRMGRRIAIGGVTSGAVTKPVADVIAALLVQQGDED
ncbi:hypothetical protein [Sagittula salina]|uniref:PH domain-containing protein n=1 Tax=Sagittula salina TaxID=2820268 RepID=A0A940S291_9RHOB|nr:hypothetical protein [Sagittula salina]MBP0481400.1 hypothetical protein [Sagittula salina]